MTEAEFEALLDELVAQLTAEARQNGPFVSSQAFENRVRAVLEEIGRPFGFIVDYDPHPYAFPDIALGEFGIEVKFTTSDSWRSVANSVFETTRDRDVIYIYVVFGKMGGDPAVRWARYADCVMHVRTSHVPRFELDINAQASLFQRFGISYDEFRNLSERDKMHHVRQYARERLKEGEHLWWIEDDPEGEHTLSITPRLYINLTDAEKRRMRAEAVLLCPQIVSGSRDRTKYTEPAMFLFTYHGVLAHQARDLFSAGSVANPENDDQGGVYVQRAIELIQDEMQAAALEMEDALFVEYWGESVPPEDRIRKWLEKADAHATQWRPSDVLFRKK